MLLPAWTYPVEDEDDDEVEAGGGGARGNLGVRSDVVVGRRVEDGDDGDAVHDDAEHCHQHARYLSSETRARSDVTQYILTEH